MRHAETPADASHKINQKGSVSSATPADDRPVEFRLLDDYLQEMRHTPTLTEDRELSLAQELQAARRAFAQAVLKLPPGWQQRILPAREVSPAPDLGWPLAEIDAIHARLLAGAEEADADGLTAVVQQAACARERIDAARQALILGNLRLVVHMAKRYRSCGIPFLDLIQEGNVGLMKAVEKFDHGRGYRLSTYAVWWIRNGISKAFIKKARLIRLPAHVKESIDQMKRVIADLMIELNRKPTEQEIAARMDIPESKVARFITMMAEPIPLENSGTDDDRFEILSRLPDLAAPDPLKSALKEDLRESLVLAMRELDPTESRILKLRFGFDGGKPLPLRRIGEVCGLSHEGVRQIQRTALRKLRDVVSRLHHSPGAPVHAAAS